MAIPQLMQARLKKFAGVQINMPSGTQKAMQLFKPATQ